MELFDYIEVFYNQRRRHSTLGQISPAAFERRRDRGGHGPMENRTERGFPQAHTRRSSLTKEERRTTQTTSATCPPNRIRSRSRASIPRRALGRLVPGVWRPTPRADAGTPAAGAGPQFATMMPWVLLRPSQFRPPAPYASAATGQIDLANAQDLADYQETKTMGAYTGSRSPDQSELALFWAGSTLLFWIRIASQVSAVRHLSLVENAHLFALLNVAMADAAIVCWDAKYR